MPISWLKDALVEAGVQVVEHGDWLNRSAGASFAPIGVLWHHTAAPSSVERPHPGLNVCIDGRPDLPGPLCHALVDYHGVFHLISANRANHAGRSRGSGPIPEGDGNTLMVGWEIDYAGDGGAGVVQQMTPAQYAASVRATAAVLARLGTDATHARGHRETSTSGKIDPSFIDLDQMRADVAAAMGGAPPEPPQPPAGTPFQTWASAVNVRPTPDTSGAPVGQLAQPTTVYVECQIEGETVTSSGYTNNLWSKISSPHQGYISNVFIQGPASLPVAACPI